MQHRNIQNYDHVKKELMIQDEEEGEGKDGSCIRKASAMHQQCIRNESPAISHPAGKDGSCIRNSSARHLQ
eukprot:gene13542-19412_t